MNYSREFGSQYPSALITLGMHKDIDDSVSNLVNEYYSYIMSNDINAASQLYETNKGKLEPYMIDMSYVNYVEEELYNIGLMALASNTIIHSTTEPETAEIDSYWIQEYE